MICESCKNEITRGDWAQVKITIMEGPPTAAREVPYPEAPSSGFGIRPHRSHGDMYAVLDQLEIS